MRPSITRATLESKCPELLAALKAEFMAEGARAERDRVRGVYAQVMPGYEALIEKLATDGKTTPEGAAMAITSDLRERLVPAPQGKSAEADVVNKASLPMRVRAFPTRW